MFKKLMELVKNVSMSIVYLAHTQQMNELNPPHEPYKDLNHANHIKIKFSRDFFSIQNPR